MSEETAEDDRRAELIERVFLTPNEAAFLFRRSQATISRWIRAGGIVVFELDGQRYVRRAEVERWITDEDRPTRRRRKLPE